jgi:hypothetical protein
MFFAFGVLEFSIVLALKLEPPPGMTAAEAQVEKARTLQVQTGMRILGLHEYEPRDRIEPRAGESDLKAALRKVLEDHRGGRESGRDLQEEVSAVLHPHRAADEPGPLFTPESESAPSSGPVALPRRVASPASR